MGKQMVLTVFVITVTFAAESELKLRIGIRGSAANCALVLRYLSTLSTVNIGFVLHLAFYLLRTAPEGPPVKQEENRKI